MESKLEEKKALVDITYLEKNFLNLINDLKANVIKALELTCGDGNLHETFLKSLFEFLVHPEVTRPTCDGDDHLRLRESPVLVRKLNQVCHCRTSRHSYVLEHKIIELLHRDIFFCFHLSV